MIEHLPAELRDRFTEMREQDLSVQSKQKSKYLIVKTSGSYYTEFLKLHTELFISYPLDRVDSLEERQKNFFSNCAKNKLKGSEKEEYESIRKEYQKVIEVYNL